MSGLAGYEKRLEQVARSLGKRSERTMVVTVPTRLVAFEGSVDSDVLVSDETRAALDEMLRVIGVTDGDLVIEIAKYTSEQPELISVT